MPARNPQLRVEAARAGAAARWKKPNADDQRRQLAATRLADYIKRTVDNAPPLTAEQRDRLALLLRGGEPLDAA